MTILPFYSATYISQAFAEKTISPDFCDFSRAQDYAAFCAISNPGIAYAPEDFLVVLNNQDAQRLQGGGALPISAAARLGWYNRSVHQAQVALLSGSGEALLANLLELNPELGLGCFDLQRNNTRQRAQRNVLAGGFALCYHTYTAEYDAFFARFLIDGSHWLLPAAKVNPRNDLPLLMQLHTLSSAAGPGSAEALAGNNPALLALHTVQTAAAGFFMDFAYDPGPFCQAMGRALPTEQAEIRRLAGAKAAGTRLPMDDNPLLLWLQEFMELAQTETAQLFAFLSNRPSGPKLPVWLLGMLHTYSRLEGQFGYTNFQRLLPDLLNTALVDIRRTEAGIELRFEPGNAKSNGIDLLAEVNRHLIRLGELRELQQRYAAVNEAAASFETLLAAGPELQQLQEKAAKLAADVQRQRDSIAGLNAEIARLSKELQEREREVNPLREKYKAISGEPGAPAPVEAPHTANAAMPQQTTDAAAETPVAETPVKAKKRSGKKKAETKATATQVQAGALPFTEPDAGQ